MEPITVVITLVQLVTYGTFLAGILGASLLVLIKRRKKIENLHIELAVERHFADTTKKEFMKNTLREVFGSLKMLAREKVPDHLGAIIRNTLCEAETYLDRYQIMNRKAIIHSLDKIVESINERIIDNSAVDNELQNIFRDAIDIFREIKHIPLEDYIGEYTFSEIIDDITRLKFPIFDDKILEILKLEEGAHRTIKNTAPH